MPQRHIHHHHHHHHHQFYSAAPTTKIHVQLSMLKTTIKPKKIKN